MLMIHSGATRVSVLALGFVLVFDVRGACLDEEAGEERAQEAEVESARPSQAQ